MCKPFFLAVAVLLGFNAYAEDIPIVGLVQSKCVISTDTPGVYGNPTADKLSTAPADGGVTPIIRYDVSLANAYKARITTPSSFSTSPSLNDTLVWTGSTNVATVSSPAMSSYETSKVVFNDSTEYVLTTVGSTWFKVNSTVKYGYNKALPGGTYRAVVQADCIAQ